MQLCSKCRQSRGERSFYSEDEAKDKYPTDVCKPCIHRSKGQQIRRLRRQATETGRTQAAVRYVVQQVQDSCSPFVYLIQGDQHYYKVGFSTNVAKRYRQLTTAASTPLQILAVAPGGRTTEQQIHKDFAKLRVRHEWFRDTKRELVAAFAKLPHSMVFLQGFVTQDAPTSVS